MLRALFRFALVAVSSAVAACGSGNRGTVERDARRDVPVAAQPTPAARDPITRPSVGFHSRAQLSEHFAKHGAEFGRVTQQEYLRAAQTLRDAPVGGNIEELRRPDGTTSRFDRSSGAFIAFNSDGTIRTFFKPNDGEAYFRRQARRIH